MDHGSKNTVGAEARDGMSRRRGDTEADVSSIPSDGDPVEDTDMLLEMRSRVRRSIDDPRPSLPLSQVDAFIDGLVAKARADAGRA